MSDKKQTAMQEILEFINGMKINQTLMNGESIETVHIPSLIHKATELLELEKEQLISTFDKGFKDGWEADTFGNENKDGNDYYNQTFNPIS